MDNQIEDHSVVDNKVTLLYCVEQGPFALGFVTADARRLWFRASAMVVDSKGLNGTRDTSLPRFGPSDGGNSLRPALACINWVVDYKRRLACPSF